MFCCTVFIIFDMHVYVHILKVFHGLNIVIVNIVSIWDCNLDANMAGLLLLLARKVICLIFCHIFSSNDDSTLQNLFLIVKYDPG